PKSAVTPNKHPTAENDNMVVAATQTQPNLPSQTLPMVVLVVTVVGMVAAAVRVAAGRVAAVEQTRKNRIPLPHVAAGGVIGGGYWSRLAAAVSCGGFGEWRRVGRVV
nr:hypothetical protein [Tanacetum cinerariifolium]